MLYNALCVCLLIPCVIACSTDTTDDKSIFPVPPIISEEETEATPPVIPVQVVPPPVPQPIIEEPVREEPIVEEPEPEPIEEEKKEPEDNRAPLFIRTTIHHGEVGIDIETDRFVFTFDENIGDAKVRLIDDKLNFDMKWEKFIVGKEITLLKFLDGFPLQAETIYLIEISWADKAGNWDPGGIITFVTRVKE